jgi:photosystem II stability/assembly factor-like uncharacterized protein
MKLRSRWFLKQMLGWEGESSTEILAQARADCQKLLADAPGDAQWELAGPTNVGGRMTCLVCHPDYPDILWAGSAAGGVWKSTNAGATWTMFWKDQEKTLNIGVLAIDLQNPNILYCGTGEANLSFDSYPGAGLYRTLRGDGDGDGDWERLAPAGKDWLPPRIGVIAIDPFDSAHLLIGGVGSEPWEPQIGPGGLYRSADSGHSWVRDVSIFPSGDYQCHSIVFHPKEQGWVFATFTEDGNRSGIWRSKNGGKNWEQLQKGLPSPEKFHRTSLAIAPSPPYVIYALAADKADNDEGHILGVFRSKDDGDSWEDAGTAHFATEKYLSSGNAIVVHPEDPGFVICGGVDLHLTKDGGKHWNQVTNFKARRGDPWYAHADHHALAIHPLRPDWIYDMNDGGMDVSKNRGETWFNRSNGLTVTMYYDLDVAPSDSRRFGGGTQDNGAEMTLTGGSDDHFPIVFGDGGWMVFDPQDAHHFYASAQNMHIVRWRQGNPQVLPDFAEESEWKIWMAFIAMNPESPNTVYVGSQRVWRTENDGDDWQPVSPFFDDLNRPNVSALEVAPADPRYVYAATEAGGFYRSWNSGDTDTWSKDLAGAALPDHIITRIETSPDSAENLFITLAGFGHHHVFRSSNGGDSWDDVDRDHLPDVPFHAAVIPPHQPNTVYVCGDAGVFVSFDRGDTWMNLTRNLPNVRIVDLVYHEKEDSLFAATYGRSLWRLRLS